MRGERGRTQKDKLLTAPELQDIYIQKKGGERYYVKVSSFEWVAFKIKTATWVTQPCHIVHKWKTDKRNLDSVSFVVSLCTKCVHSGELWSSPRVTIWTDTVYEVKKCLKISRSSLYVSLL